MKSQAGRLFAFIVALAAILLATPAHGQVAVTMGTYSNYVLQNGVELYEGSVLQTDVFGPLPGGFYVDIWFSTSLNGRANSGRELDWKAGWTSRHVEVSFALFDLHPVFSSRTSDVLYPDVKVFMAKSFGHHTLNPYVEGAWVIATKGAGNSRPLGKVGLSHSWRLKRRLELGQNAWGMYDSGVFHGNPGWTIRYRLGLTTRIGNTNLTPFFQRSAALSQADRENRNTWGIELARRF